MERRILIGTVCLGALIAATPALAQTADVNDKINALQQQIQQQQTQLQQQQQQLKTLLDQVNASQAQAKQANDTAQAVQAQVKTVATQTAPGGSTGPSITMSPSNRPGWRSADGKNSVELTTLLQLDNGINSFRPASKSSPIQKLQSGINARRAQIGVNAKFMDDWTLEFAYDMGNSDETIGASGGPAAGFKLARMSYTGIKPFGTQLNIEMGYETPPVMLDEAISSSSGLFMEHPTPDRLATGLAAGVSRSVFGFRDYDDRMFAALLFTGPKAGDDHTAASGSEPIALVGRATYNVLQSGDNLLHVGGGFQRLLQTVNKSGSAFKSLSYSDEAELRVDPTNVMSVGLGSAANPVTGATDFSVELAGTYERLFAAGEYFHYAVSRAGLADVAFQGAYGEVAYSLTGEHHKYVPNSGAFANLIPAQPLSMSSGGWGALEVAARYSWVNMNDQFTIGASTAANASAVAGGEQQNLTLGVNWYPTTNVRIQGNYLHGFLARNATTTPWAQTGGKWDALAVRTQFAF